MSKAKSRVARYLDQALAPNTVSAYASDLRHFRAWGGRIPATPQLVAQYLADCASHMKASTLARRIAAIRHAHVAIGRASPTDSGMVKRTLRSIRRVHGSAVKQAVPITVELLRKLVRPCPADCRRGGGFTALGYPAADGASVAQFSSPLHPGHRALQDELLCSSSALERPATRRLQRRRDAKVNPFVCRQPGPPTFHDEHHERSYRFA